MRHHHLPVTAIILLALSLSACSGNDNETTIDLGSVSIGQQLIDIKRARDAGAITGREYRRLKEGMLSLVDNASTAIDDDENDDNHGHREEAKGQNAEREHDTDDDDSGFLF